MIDQRNTVKITDFGIAGMNRETSVSGISSQKPVLPGKGISPFHTAAGIGFGTPTHMAPEQFVDASICDERSDIYSFGIVMFQMISQGSLPYHIPFPKENSSEAAAKYWHEMFKLHNQASVPVVDSPLFSLIAKCLDKDANRRYARFDELRADLEAVLKRIGGRPFSPQKQEKLDAWDWNNKAISMSNIGDKERALQCIDKAIDMNRGEARFWANKGGILKTMSRVDEGLSCCDRALSLNPDDTIALAYKGQMLMLKKQFNDALDDDRHAAEIEPSTL